MNSNNLDDVTIISNTSIKNLNLFATFDLLRVQEPAIVKSKERSLKASNKAYTAFTPKFTAI